MAYLQRIDVRPTFDGLTDAEISYIQQRFDPYANEVIVNREAIYWDEIDEIEVAVAARTSGPAGWIVKNFVMGGDRYHVGIYHRRREEVLPNATLNAARYLVQMIAFYAPKRIKYTGPEDIAPLTEF